MRSRDIVCATVVAAGVILVAVLPVSSFGQDQNQGPAGQNPGPAGQNPGPAGQNQGFVPAPGAQGKGGGKGGGRGRGGKQRPPSAPTPHLPDGRVNLGPIPGERGVWEGNAGATLATNVPPGLDNATMNLPTNLKIPDVPFLPWARAVYAYRQATTTKDDPHTKCHPSGGPRPFHTPYGFEFLNVDGEKTLYVVEVGGPHSWRAIYMDGRPHPKDLEPSFYGHSVGRWDGETLVVDSVGYNEKFWLTREGIPSTEYLHLTERFTRTDHDTLKYEAIIDDPGAYSAPWTGGWLIRWQPNEEMYEYACQDNNRDPVHMFGGPRN